MIGFAQAVQPDFIRLRQPMLLTCAMKNMAKTRMGFFGQKRRPPLLSLSWTVPKTLVMPHFYFWNSRYRQITQDTLSPPPPPVIPSTWVKIWIEISIFPHSGRIGALMLVSGDTKFTGRFSVFCVLVSPILKSFQDVAHSKTAVLCISKKKKKYFFLLHALFGEVWCR